MEICWFTKFPKVEERFFGIGLSEEVIFSISFARSICISLFNSAPGLTETIKGSVNVSCNSLTPHHTQTLKLIFCLQINACVLLLHAKKEKKLSYPLLFFYFVESQNYRNNSYVIHYCFTYTHYIKSKYKYSLKHILYFPYILYSLTVLKCKMHELILE